MLVMRRIFLMMIALPVIAFAQGYSTAPIIVNTSNTTAEPISPNLAPKPLPPNFPEIAITRIGENTTGQHVDAPATPATPSAGTAPPTPNAPQNPASPTPPPSPVSKLWPRDTVPIFVQSCAGFHVELVPACTCVITELMVQMPHDEFLKLSENNTIENDGRLLGIRQKCVATPRKRAEGE